MSDQTQPPKVSPPREVLSLDPVAHKWRNLVDRRRAHFVELYLTGRWKRYYAERWTEIAPQPGDAKKPADFPKN
jgi:hypothetical protein